MAAITAIELLVFSRLTLILMGFSLINMGSIYVCKE